MEYSNYAGLSSERLDCLRNLDIRKRSVYSGSTFSCANNIYEILHNCPSEEKKKKKNIKDENLLGHDCIYPPKNMNYAGLQSAIKNDIDIRNRRIKNDIHSHDGILKDIIQNNVKENELNSSKCFFSDKGYVLTPKKCLARHVDDSEIDKYFSTKYAVTDKSSGRTEIMVERKPGCSNIIVQNFSEFDAYATYKKQDARKNRRDSFVHTKMGIVPKDGSSISDKNCKARGMFTELHRSDNIAPDNYWLCPTIESEEKKKKKY
ncbi:subpellicular microtubule protein 2, putative [Plasmodium malariae]|uniref:Subpellicular microtubule protein 2, putative n=2 Tax=Plasmodium (Plasmodium) TaxID=418103 RepID=A0A1D3TF79_PLAMA|nr:subpellicular microtubule protein 2, putative [Plasmodium malariae]SCP03586.1 subpellicular microtubule protein 2, putative [Plasmodium malariae]